MKTDKEKHDLRGAVKSVRVETAQFKEQDGQLVEQAWFDQTIAFNAQGNIIEHVHRNPDGSTFRTINNYSDAGQLLAMNSYDADNNLVHEVIYSYDAQGRLLTEQTVVPDKTTTAHIAYSYDDAGRKTKTQLLDFATEANVLIGIEGTSTSIGAGDAKAIKTRYDEQDEAIEVTVYNADDAVVSRVEIKRDALGNPLEEIQYVGDIFPFSQCSPGASPIEETPALTAEQQAEFAAELAAMFAPGTPMSKHIHEYDEAGRLIESKLTMMGMNASLQKFTYDEAGNKSEETSYDEDGQLQSKAIFTREYDEHGNWTKELVSTASTWDAEFNLSTPSNVTRRTIAYF